MADDIEAAIAEKQPGSGEKRIRAKRSKRRKRQKQDGMDNGQRGWAARIAFPKDPISKCLRIPRGILDQNGGNECTPKAAAGFAKIGWSGPVGVEISSATKYGLLERPSPGKVKPTDLARKIIRPQQSNDEVEGLREAVVNAPLIGDFYKRYRGENLPEREFLINAAVDSLKVSKERVEEFVDVFLQSLTDAHLLEDFGDGKKRLLDTTLPAEIGSGVGEEQIKKLSKGITVQSTDTCFVMMPFLDPLGSYYETVYKPAIEKAKLNPVRADAEIFGTGKIIDQIWTGINNARVLVAELTGRNPNVLYELGLAHALHKPVVLVSSNKDDVPFDVQHVRVIYYDMRDPFWGNKLIEKVAENILSAIKNPKEAILFAVKE